MVKKLPAMQEIWEMSVQSLGQKDPLKEEMATQSSILAWRIPWMEEPGGLQSMGSQTVIMTEHAHIYTHTCTLTVHLKQHENIYARGCSLQLCLHICKIFEIT